MFLSALAGGDIGQDPCGPDHEQVVSSKAAYLKALLSREELYINMGIQGISGIELFLPNNALLK